MHHQHDWGECRRSLPFAAAPRQTIERLANSPLSERSLGRHRVSARPIQFTPAAALTADGRRALSGAALPARRRARRSPRPQ